MLEFIDIQNMSLPKCKYKLLCMPNLSTPTLNKVNRPPKNQPLQQKEGYSNSSLSASRFFTFKGHKKYTSLAGNGDITSIDAVFQARL